MEQTELIGAIGDLSDAHGATPAGVRAWLRDDAPKAPLAFARGKAQPTTRGQALTTLCTLDASDAALDEAIAIAGSDPSPFLQSRASSLRNWGNSHVSEVSRLGRPQPQKLGAEQAALRYLRERNIGAIYGALTRAIGEGDASVVDNLIAAGGSVKAPKEASARRSLISDLATACDAERRIDAKRLNPIFRSPGACRL